jgi:peroxiredoxin
MRRDKMKRLVVLSLFAIFITAILLPSGCCNSTPDLPVAPKVGSLAPDFEVTTIDGATVSLQDLKGKPILLLFWRTTCSACNANMPHVQAAFEERGEEVHFIAIETGSSSDSVQQYVENNGLGFTVGLGGGNTAPETYNIAFIPTTFFIDSRGVIQGKQVGAYSSAEALLAAMEDLQ